MEKKILLVYPEIPTTYWSFKYTLPFVNFKSAMPPLGLLTVAALMPENYELRLIDMNVDDLTEADINDSDMVFVSAMIIQKKSLQRIIKLCNKCGVPVAAGGPYPSSSYKEIRGVDHFILNEAEITLPEFILDYENGNPKEIYTSEIKPDIEKTPSPRFDLIKDINVYASLSLQYSRGCPFNCEFCDIIEMLGRNQRTKDTMQFISEVQALYDTGYKGALFIVDDNFIGNKTRVKSMLKELIKWQDEHNHPFSLFTEASINLAHDDELMDLMAAAGFNSVFVGIETPDTATLASANKHQNLKEDIFDNIKKIQHNGLEVMGGFIVGFDADPENIFDRQIDFIQKAGIPMAMVGLLTALPNTQLHRRLREEGRLLNISSGNNTHDLELNFVPKMHIDKLISGYKYILSEIYNPKKYFTRCLTLLSRLDTRPLPKKPLEMRYVKAFIMSLCKQGFSRYGFTYINYLLKVILTKPGHFVLSVNLAVKGFHFFKMTKEILQADEFSTMLDKYLNILNTEAARISSVFNENALSAVKLEEYITQLKNSTRKKYRRLSLDTQHYLNDKLDKFDSYCDAFLLQWKDKLI